MCCSGIGRLVRVDRKARMGRNPATGVAIKIPAKKVVKFRVAKAVKDAIVPPKVKASSCVLRTHQTQQSDPKSKPRAARLFAGARGLVLSFKSD